jgi:hypothetical protein
MGMIIGLIAIVVFIFVCKKLSAFFFRAARYFDEKESRRAYNERCIMESLEDIRNSVVPLEERSIDHKESLLLANQEIFEKDSLSEAMKNELGIM